jgi:serine/threonine protein kinase
VTADAELLPEPQTSATTPLPVPGDGLLAFGEVVAASYETRGLLGRGGMSQVFEAKDRALNRRVAVKVADPRQAPHSDEHVRREGLALAAMRHPSLVTIHAAGEHRRMPFLVLERIYGLSLEEHFHQRRLANQPFTLDETLDVLIGLVEGLSVIHHAGIVHRDVKPGNIMLAPRGRTVLMDLGIFVADSERADAQAIGTPHYMAPEAILNRIEPGLGHLVDLYSVGIMAFHMLTGTLPYDACEVTDILCQHLDSPVPDLAGVRGGIPAKLSILIRALMAKDPRERPPHADDVLWQLIQFRRRPPETMRPLRVLIVDDDGDARRILKSCVERSVASVEVRLAANAEQALRQVRREAPDVMLLDLRMPGTNGLELYLALAGMRCLDRAETVIVSGDAQARDLEILRTLGATKFVQKGSSLPHELARLLRTAAMRRTGSRST